MVGGLKRRSRRAAVSRGPDKLQERPIEALSEWLCCVNLDELVCWETQVRYKMTHINQVNERLDESVEVCLCASIS